MLPLFVNNLLIMKLNMMVEKNNWQATIEGKKQMLNDGYFLEEWVDVLFTIWSTDIIVSKRSGNQWLSCKIFDIVYESVGTFYRNIN